MNNPDLATEVARAVPQGPEAVLAAGGAWMATEGSMQDSRRRSNGSGTNGKNDSGNKDSRHSEDSDKHHSNSNNPTDHKHKKRRADDPEETPLLSREETV
jgi:hypothetical protein